MEIPTNPSQLIDPLRAWFFPKDRNISLADSTFIEGPNIVTPGTPVVNRGRLYWKDKCWYQLDEDGTETALCNSDLGTWTDWTPTVDQNGAVAATVNLGRYSIINNTATAMAKLTVTGTGSAGNPISVRNIPSAIQPANPAAHVSIGAGVIIDGVVRYNATIEANAASLFYFMAYNGTRIGANPSFALASGDVISLMATYEIA